MRRWGTGVAAVVLGSLACTTLTVVPAVADTTPSARQLIAATKAAASRPGQVLHTTLTGKDDGDTTPVEAWIDVERGLVRTQQGTLDDGGSASLVADGVMHFLPQSQGSDLAASRCATGGLAASLVATCATALPRTAKVVATTHDGHPAWELVDTFDRSSHGTTVTGTNRTWFDRASKLPVARDSTSTYRSKRGTTPLHMAATETHEFVPASRCPATSSPSNP